MTTLHAIILAAGHGKRMKSTLPKVLHAVCGRPLVHYAVQAAIDAGASTLTVVVGHERERVVEYLSSAFGDRVTFAIQHEQLGTGHAVQQALSLIPSASNRVLVLCGDTPLLDPKELSALDRLLTADANRQLSMLTCAVDDPGGYGRIIRDNDGSVQEIREDRDLQDSQRAIREVNPAVYCARTPFLSTALSKVQADNAQKEYYLTDIVAMAVKQGGVLDLPGHAHSLVGINDRSQLALADDIMRERILTRLRKSGVTIRSGALIDDTVAIEADAYVEAGVHLRGTTTIAAGARIDAGCVVEDSSVGSNAWLKPYSVVSSSTVAQGAQIGPFAHLRPKSRIGVDAHIGNFVETKNTEVHRGAKANHLAYLGDGEIGEGANVGAGTIFCNYDGYLKHKTTIGPGAFIGSDSQIVAPVTIGEGAYVATGTTVTADVPAQALAISRVRQENKLDYAPRLRARLKAAKEAKAAGK